LERITKGHGKQGDIELLEELASFVKDASLCGLGQTAPNPVLSTLRYFRSEYEAHIGEQRCPAGVCTALVHYEIDPEKCKACGMCKKKCPVDAIEGAPKVVHKIIQEKCIRCGTCFEVCPKKFSAILRT
jgi:NADP-reducing hydrogenase subunit HndC